MAQPAIVFWIIGAPFVVAIVDLIRTRAALRGSVSSEAGVWSKSLKIERPAEVTGGRP